MFIKSDIETKLDAQINKLLDQLKEATDVVEYDKLVERISKLHKLKAEERPKKINPDTVLVVIANIAGIIWLTRYERDAPITSKALGFVMRPK